MEIAQVHQLVADYRREIAALADNGDGRDILAWTGEKLAEAAEMFRRSDDADRAAMAVYLLFVAEPHTGSLYDAGMAFEALATECMVLMTLLMGKVNPAEIRLGYIAFLQKIYDLAADLADTNPSETLDPDRHLEKIKGMTAALATATYNALAQSEMPSSIAGAHSHIQAAATTLPHSATTFNGATIVATMAIDIAADIIARLKALGLEG